MDNLKQNPILNVIPLPVDIILSPSWWHKHEGICFDRDFFFHPARRVEVERKMEQVLYDRWGQYGLGKDRNKNLPQIGAVKFNCPGIRTVQCTQYVQKRTLTAA